MGETIWPGIVSAIVGLSALSACFRFTGRSQARWPRWRRRANVAALVVVTVGWVVGCYAWLIEPRMLVVREVEVVSEHWSGAPLRIGVIADTHVPGPHVDSARVAQIVAVMNRLEPNIVVLLGDYVGEGAQRVDRSPRVYAAMSAGIEAFSHLEAPLGVIAVLGNRDRTFDRAAIVRALEEAGVIVVAGRSTVVFRPSGDFSIVGLANEQDAGADLSAALAGAPAGDRIVISHSPEPFAELPSDIALMLAGHTHCGQVSVPFWGRPVTHLPANSTLVCHRVDEAGRTLYTTSGIGTSGLPVRFLNPPEIVLITLRGAT